MNDMNNVFSSHDILFFKKLIIQAGRKALRLQKKHFEVKRKEDSSIVTDVDLMIQDMLMRDITKRYKSVNFIYEEGCCDPLSVLRDDAITVIIDPIDGTSMYSMHLPLWCISVGIFYKNEPKYGFVFAPGLDLMFYNDNDRSYINGEPVRIASTYTIDTESNIFYATEIYRKIDIVFPGKARNLGSTALHACLTIDNVRNRTLAFIGKSWIWDWAGAIPIILKSGGHVRYISGDFFDLDTILTNGYKLPDFLIAYTHSDFEIVKKCFRRIP